MKKSYNVLLALICPILIVSCVSSNEGEKDIKSLKEVNTAPLVSDEAEDTLEEEGISSVEEEVQFNTEKEETKTEVVPTKVETQPLIVLQEQYNLLVGTWLFTKAMAGESDASTRYLYGYLDGKAKKNDSACKRNNTV